MMFTLIVILFIVYSVLLYRAAFYAGARALRDAIIQNAIDKGTVYQIKKGSDE